MEPAAYEALAREEERHWWFEGRRRVVRSLLARHLTPRVGRRILDVGCGTGGMYPLLSELGHAEGAEGSSAAIDLANRRFPGFRVHEARLPDGLPAGSWDTITAFDVIEHLDAPVPCLGAMRERLAPGGQVAVTVPAYEFLWSDHDVVHHHKRRYTARLLRDHLEQAGFQLRYVTYFNSLLFPAVAAVRLVERLLPRRQRPDAAAAGDLTSTPSLLNEMLTRAFASEAVFLRRARLPFGVSLFAVADARGGR